MTRTGFLTPFWQVEQVLHGFIAADQEVSEAGIVASSKAPQYANHYQQKNPVTT
jgi:hypothetical protein